MVKLPNIAAQTTDRPFPDGLLLGTLHAFIAFDWGEEVDLDAARRLLPAASQDLPRRRRTPASVAYSPAPLRYDLPDLAVRVPGVTEPCTRAEATLFDFAGVSLSLRIPFELTSANLQQLASQLAEPQWLVDAVKPAVDGLYQTLLPAIREAKFSPLREEYFVFELPPAAALPAPKQLLTENAAWLASLLRLDSEVLSDDEVVEALHVHLSYSPDDLLVCEWTAAVLIDRQCDETLQTIEFANLQLLELRFIDTLLDQRLSEAYRLIHPRTWLPFWRTHSRPLRALGELKIDANSLFERTGNVLKLVGDQYLARVYRMLGQRFHLDSWEQSIRRSLEVVESVYTVVSDQAATWRTELLELIVILLIVFEIILAVVRH